METKEIITLTVACIGAVTGISGLALSIYNAWKAHDKEQIKLEASMSQAVSSRIEGSFLSVTVVNKSAFPITIQHVEIVSEIMKQRQLDNWILADLPCRLDSRTSHSFNFMPQSFDSKVFDAADHISIRTADGFELRITEHLDGIKQDVLARREKTK